MLSLKNEWLSWKISKRRTRKKIICHLSVSGSDNNRIEGKRNNKSQAQFCCLFFIALRESFEACFSCLTPCRAKSRSEWERESERKKRRRWFTFGKYFSIDFHSRVCLSLHVYGKVCRCDSDEVWFSVFILRHAQRTRLKKRLSLKLDVVTQKALRE